MRGLLCVPQSSKERLRRSRTESSVAAPATEELAGEARQVRPARAACGFVSTDFRFLTGARGLEGARPSSFPRHQTLAEVQISTSAPPASRRSRNVSSQYHFLYMKKEVRRHPARQTSLTALRSGLSRDPLSDESDRSTRPLPHLLPDSPELSANCCPMA